MKKNDNARFAGKGKIYTGVVVVALILVLMISAIIVLENIPTTPTSGVMDSEEILAVSIQYSTEVKDKFRTQFTNYINTIISPLGQELGSSFGLADVVLESMSQANISSDKVVALGNYLETKDGSEFFYRVFLRYIDVDYDDIPSDETEMQLFLQAAIIEFLGLTDYESGDELPGGYDSSEFEEYLMDKLILQSETNILLVIFQEINVPVVLDELVEHTIITTEELGRICYYILVQFMAGDTQEDMLAFGVNSFAALFVDTYTIYEVISLVQSGEILSRSEARVVRELLYEMGDNYNKILEEFGQDGIESLLGTDDPYILDETQDYYEQINFMASNLYGLPTYAITFAGDYFTKLDSGMFDAFADYTSSGSEDELMYAMIIAMIDGYESHLYALQEVGMTEADMIEKLSYVFAGMDSIEGLDGSKPVEDGVMEAYRIEYEAKLTTLFSSAKSIYEDYGYITTQEEVASLTEEDLLRIKELTSSVTEELDVVVSGLNKLSFILVYSTIMNLQEGETDGDN